MQKNIWAKTVLTSYRFLEKVSDAIDRLVETKALNSFYMGCNNFSQNNVLEVSESLINLIERKKKLINLKVVCDKSLLSCKEEYAQILIERYIDDDKAKEIAKRHNLSMRTYFRRLESAEADFSAFLKENGYNENFLAKTLLSEKWIYEIYSKFSSIPREELFQISEVYLKKIALS